MRRLLRESAGAGDDDSNEDDPLAHAILLAGLKADTTETFSPETRPKPDSSLRHRDHVVVAGDLAPVEGLEKLRDGAQARLRARAVGARPGNEPAVRHRSDERRLRVDRQRR